MQETTTCAGWKIRPCAARDLEALRAICEETSSIGLRSQKDRRYLLLTFCDPYVLYSADCFVATDPDDRPVGYVLCAADTRRFFRTFRKKVLPEIARLGPRYGLAAFGVCLQQMVCAVFAPAHLHIDLTASVRRRGVGSALIGTLRVHLAAQGVARVQLTVNGDNAAAIRFYEKNGFKTVVRAFGGRVMRADCRE